MNSPAVRSTRSIVRALRGTRRPPGQRGARGVWRIRRLEPGGSRSSRPWMSRCTSSCSSPTSRCPRRRPGRCCPRNSIANAPWRAASTPAASRRPSSRKTTRACAVHLSIICISRFASHSSLSLGSHRRRRKGRRARRLAEWVSGSTICCVTEGRRGRRRRDAGRGGIPGARTVITRADNAGTSCSHTEALRATLEAFEQFAIDVILERRYGKRAALLAGCSMRWSGSSAAACRRGCGSSGIALQARHPWRARHFHRQSHRRRHGQDAGGREVRARRCRTAGGASPSSAAATRARKPPLLRRLQRKWLGSSSPSRASSTTASGCCSIPLCRRRALHARAHPSATWSCSWTRTACAPRCTPSRDDCDMLMLDDGMQYLHLEHRLDICLIDRQAPFGNEFLLPRGTLREPPANLRRASYIFITKSDGHRQGRAHRDASAATTAPPRSSRRTAPARSTCKISTTPTIAARSIPPREIHRRASAASRAPESFEEKLTDARRESGRSPSASPITTASATRNSQDFVTPRRPPRPRLIVTTEKDSVRFPSNSRARSADLLPARGDRNPRRRGELAEPRHPHLRTTTRCGSG